MEEHDNYVCEVVFNKKKNKKKRYLESTRLLILLFYFEEFTTLCLIHDKPVSEINPFQTVEKPNFSILKLTCETKVPFTVHMPQKDIMCYISMERS